MQHPLQAQSPFGRDTLSDRATGRGGVDPLQQLLQVVVRELAECARHGTAVENFRGLLHQRGNQHPIPRGISRQLEGGDDLLAGLGLAAVLQRPVHPESGGLGDRLGAGQMGQQ